MHYYPVSSTKASLKHRAVPSSLWQNFYINLRISLTVLCAAVLLNACATTDVRRPSGVFYPQQQTGQNTPNPTQTPTQQTPTQTKTPTPKEPSAPSQSAQNLEYNRMSKPGFTPAFMDGDTIKRIALILPFSAKSSRLRQEAASMLQAAELAVFNRKDDSVLLMALDSQGTPSGAKIAADNAADQGADLILGPILAGSVHASAKIARKAGIPLIGFSTDTRVAGNGTYLLSFPPEAEVRRVTEYILQSGATKFAYLGPNSRYGERVLNAYKNTITQAGGVMTGVEQYSGNDISVMQEPAGRLAGIYTQQHLSNQASGNPQGEAAFHVVLMPEGGTALRSLAPLLPFFEEKINPSSVQFMGTGLWNRDEIVREPALRGGIFAGPDRKDKQAFASNFDAVFGQEPSRLASLAYDGVNIAAFIAEGPSQSHHQRLTDPAGFFGVDGLVRFDSSGIPDRGLAIYQIKNGRFNMVDPAPKSMNPTN